MSIAGTFLSFELDFLTGSVIVVTLRLVLFGVSVVKGFTGMGSKTAQREKSFQKSDPTRFVLSGM
ncbi:hypothetical protein JW906_09020 [bacterium]|nr:hypothetical protein [bacterium]